jgi:aminoglycoside 6'-N-acetyltransferase
MRIPLETPRLLLRNFCDDDIEPFMAYRNDPQVYRYQGWAVPFDRMAALKFINSMKRAIPGVEDIWFQFALEHKAAHQMIGDVGFLTRSGHYKDQAVLGFTLARPYWGQGFANEAVRAVINFLFAELKLHRIQADCDAENAASSRLLERLGFRREAHHVASYWVGDHWADEYVYAVLGREWRKG